MTDTETINVITIQKELQDLTDIRPIDRQDVLNSVASQTKLNLEVVLNFDYLYKLYVKPPKTDDITEVITNYILTYKKPKVVTNMNIKASGKTLWSYYLPKDPPSDTIRIDLPVYTKGSTLSDSNSYFIFPKYQSLDIKSLDGVNIINKEAIRKYYNNTMNKSYFLDPKYLTVPVGKNKYKSLLNNIKNIPREPDKLPGIYRSFTKKIEETGIPINKNINDQSLYIGNILSLGLKSPFIDYLHNKQENLLGYEWTLYLNNFNDAVSVKKKEKEAIKEQIYRNSILNIIKIYFPHENIELKSSISRIINSLDKKKREYVLSVYKSNQLLQEGNKDNNCPHINLYKKTRRSTTNRDIRYNYNKLKNFIKDSGTTDKIHICKQCNFNICCPHVLELTELQLRNAEPREILEAMDKYKDKTDNEFEHFCKICYEELPKHNNLEYQEERYVIGFETIRKQLWINILNTYNTVKIIPIIGLYDFSSTISNVLLRTIINTKNVSLQNELMVYNKTDELTPLLELYLWIYIYSYILHLIRDTISNPDPRHIRISLVENIKGKNVSDYGKALIDRFSTKHRGLMSLNKDIDITLLFKQVFTDMSMEDIPFYIERFYSREKEVYDFLRSNTYFNYTFNIAIITNFISLDEYTSTRDYEKIIEKLTDKSLLDSIKLSNVTILERLTVGNNDSFIVKTYNTYKEWFTGKVKNKDNFQPLLEMDKTFKYQEYLKWIAPTKNLQSQKVYKQRKFTNDTNLTSYISLEGIPYVWDILIYKNGTEIKKGQGIESRNILLDYKSSKTGIIKSQTYKNDNKVTIDNYLKKEKEDGFYQHYSVLCPEDGLHTYDLTSSSPVCTKCGYKKKRDDSYYKKYYKIFIDDIGIVNKNIITNKNINQSILLTEKKWDLNLIPIIEVSKMTDTPQIVFFYFGSMNKFSYEIMSSGKVPSDYPKPNNIQDTQIHTCLSHFYNMVSLYNMSKNGINEDLEFKKVMKSNGISDNEIGYLYKNIPLDIYTKYVERFDNLFMVKITPTDAFHMIIQTICEFIMDVSRIDSKISGGSQTNKTLGFILSNYLINTTLNYEYLTCKAVNPNYSLLKRRKNQLVDSTEAFDQEFQEEYEDEDIQLFVNDGDYTGYNDSLE